MVVMSIQAYENVMNNIETKLDEADNYAEFSDFFLHLLTKGGIECKIILKPKQGRFGGISRLKTPFLLTAQEE